jgi:hypothetical protein
MPTDTLVEKQIEDRQKLIEAADHDTVFCASRQMRDPNKVCKLDEIRKFMYFAQLYLWHKFEFTH